MAKHKITVTAIMAAELSESSLLALALFTLKGKIANIEKLGCNVSLFGSAFRPNSRLSTKYTDYILTRYGSGRWGRCNFFGWNTEFRI